MKKFIAMIVAVLFVFAIASVSFAADAPMADKAAPKMEEKKAAKDEAAPAKDEKKAEKKAKKAKKSKKAKKAEKTEEKKADEKPAEKK